MKEQDLMCIKLHGVSKVGLRKIIDFIYTAKLSLNMDNLQDTLEAASFLQILPVLDFCKVFLISGVRHFQILKSFSAIYSDIPCLEKTYESFVYTCKTLAIREECYIVCGLETSREESSTAVYL